MSPELEKLKEIKYLNKINTAKSNSFSIGIILLRMNLLLKEKEIENINKCD